MKKRSALGLACAALVAVAFVPVNPLVGRWQRQFADGRTALAVFRPDGSLDFFLNGKAFGSGTYYIRQDTFRLSYPSCDGAYFGTYRLGFFAPDSVRFTVVQDTCSERRAGMNGVTLRRINTNKPPY